MLMYANVFKKYSPTLCNTNTLVTIFVHKNVSTISVHHSILKTVHPRLVYIKTCQSLHSASLCTQQPVIIHSVYY